MATGKRTEATFFSAAVGTLDFLLFADEFTLEGMVVCYNVVVFSKMFPCGKRMVGT